MKFFKSLSKLLSFLSFFLVLAVSPLLMPSQVSAATIEDTTQAVELEILSPEEAQRTFLEDQPETKGITHVTLFIVRNGGTSCELYVKWAGGDLYNSFRYKRLIVKKNSINPDVYLNQYNQYNWLYVNTVASVAGTAHIAYLNIPTHVSNVFIETRQFHGYNLSAANWIAQEIKGPETIG